MAYKKPRLQDRQSVVEDVRSAQTFTRLGLLIQKQEDTNESVKSVADGISDIKDALVDSAESNEDTNKGIGALTNVFSEQLDFMKQEKLNNAGDILEDQNEDDGDDTPELKGFAKFLNMFKKDKKEDKKGKKGLFGLLKKILIFGGIFTALVSVFQVFNKLIGAFTKTFEKEKLDTIVDDSMGRTTTDEERESGELARLRRLEESNETLGRIIGENTKEQALVNKSREGMGQALQDRADDFADGLDGLTAKLGLTFGELLKGMGFEEAGQNMVDRAYKKEAKESFGSRRAKKRTRNELELIANSREDEEIEKRIADGTLTEKEGKSIRRARNKAQGRGIGKFLSRNKVDGFGRKDFANENLFNLATQTVERYEKGGLLKGSKYNYDFYSKYLANREKFMKGELEFENETEYESMLQKYGIQSNTRRQMDMLSGSGNFRAAGFNSETGEGEQYTKEMINISNRFSDGDINMTEDAFFRLIQESSLLKEKGGDYSFVGGETVNLNKSETNTFPTFTGVESSKDGEPNSYSFGVAGIL